MLVRCKRIVSEGSAIARNLGKKFWKNESHRGSELILPLICMKMFPILTEYETVQNSRSY
jgi:hypothetical protein